MPKVRTKTEVATIKLSREVRAAWEAAATAERRSLANVFEVAILAYCKQLGIELPAVPPVVVTAAAPATGVAPAQRATAKRTSATKASKKTTT